MNDKAASIISKVWSFCHTLRDLTPTEYFTKNARNSIFQLSA
jgi:hypothetical protein